jgi:hypothetical protein
MGHLRRLSNIAVEAPRSPSAALACRSPRRNVESGGLLETAGLANDSHRGYDERGFQGDMRMNTRCDPASVGVCAVALAVALGSAGACAKGANGSQRLEDLLAGNTLSAVIWAPRPAAMSTGGALTRFMLQAYLRQDGTASVRVWDAARNAYTTTAERNWTGTGDKFCLDLPNPAPARICVEVHTWGPRIAGVGTAPYVMLDGDVRPGNTIRGGH